MAKSQKQQLLNLLLNLLLNFAGTQLCSLQHRTNTNVRYTLEAA